MDFNFGNNNNPEKPEDENNNMFSFNLDNSNAEKENSNSEGSSPFDWTPDETSNSDESVQNDIDIDKIIGVNDNEEAPQFVPEIPDASLEEASSDAAEAVSNFISDESPAEDKAEELFDKLSEDSVLDADAQDALFEDAQDADVQEALSEDALETDAQDALSEDALEADAQEAPSEDALETDAQDALSEDALEADAQDALSEDATEGDVQMNDFNKSVSVPAALDKKVRTPDGEQEYLLSELIDVETGEPLDLTSLIPEELLTSADVAEPSDGFSIGAVQSTTGGFDMSSGEKPAAPSKRKRPARPKAEKKKGGGILGVLFGALLAFILFPYVMAILELCGVQSNFPVPAPGITSSYKHIPEWWPEWAMFVFPGRTPENSAPAPAENPADKPAPVVPADNANPADDAAAEDEVPADNAAEAEDGSFNPEDFLGNGEENAAEPIDAPADDEPVEPGVINAPQYTSDDVSNAVANVGTAFKAAKKIDDTVYAALNDMAEKSTFVDTSAVDDQLKDAMSKVRAAMGNFGTKPALASALAEKWAARVEDDSDNAGVLFVGTLSEVSQRDGYQIGAIEIEGQDSLVEVVGLRKLKPAVGDKVVVCGKRIANPGKNLGGFTDNGLPVVWGGIIIKAENK